VAGGWEAQLREAARSPRDSSAGLGVTLDCASAEELSDTGGAAVVTADGFRAHLRVVVDRFRCNDRGYELLQLNCLLVAHLPVLVGARHIARGEGCERRRASATLRSSIDLCCSQNMKI
jgi:hypothetical protein